MSTDRPVVFLDLDGVLLDVRTRFWAVQVAAVEALGGTPLSINAYWRGRQEGRTGRELAEAGGLRPPALDHFQEEWLARIESKEFLPLDNVVPGAIEALDTLGRDRTRVLTTLRANPETLEWQLRSFGLHAHLDLVLPVNPRAGVTWEAKAGAMRECGLPLEGGWMVGDTEVDIRAGKLLGLRTIGVLSGLRGPEALQAEEPDYVLASLAEAVPAILCQ